MWCWRRVKQIKWTYKVTIEDVLTNWTKKELFLDTIIRRAENEEWRMKSVLHAVVACEIKGLKGFGQIDDWREKRNYRKLPNLPKHKAKKSVSRRLDKYIKVNKTVNSGNEMILEIINRKWKGIIDLRFSTMDLPWGILPFIIINQSIPNCEVLYFKLQYNLISQTVYGMGKSIFRLFLHQKRLFSREMKFMFR